LGKQREGKIVALLLEPIWINYVSPVGLQKSVCVLLLWNTAC